MAAVYYFPSGSKYLDLISVRDVGGKKKERVNCQFFSLGGEEEFTRS